MLMHDYGDGKGVGLVMADTNKFFIKFILI